MIPLHIHVYHDSLVPYLAHNLVKKREIKSCVQTFTTENVSPNIHRLSTYKGTVLVSSDNTILLTQLCVCVCVCACNCFKLCKPFQFLSPSLLFPLFTQLVDAYKALERERDQLKQLVESNQAKALRRLDELQDELELDKKAKRDVEVNYTLMLSEKDELIRVLRQQVSTNTASPLRTII